jgi:hypothetical protein
MGTQSQDPTTQKQSIPANPGSAQEQGQPPQDPKRRPPGDSSPQQGKDAGEVPTSDDEIDGGADETSTESGSRPS